MTQLAPFTLVRDADVRVTHIVNDKKQNVAQITVNEQFQHQFSPKSRISKHLDMMSADELSARMTNGTYFFIGDQMVDMRDGSYNGFVHTDESVDKFMDVLGYEDRVNMRFHHSRKHKDDDAASSLVLRKVWSKNEIIVPGYQSGGDFNSELSFVWNPFVKTINSSFDLVRMICSNGMVGMTSFLNTKVPLVNRMEEHLDIASRQIQNKVNSVIVDRVKNMSMDRASVADCLLVEQHIMERLYSPTDKTPDERQRLLSLLAASSPQSHLGGVYQDGVFTDKHLASQLPSHLTQFDVFNLATELRTHTTSSAKSSDSALDKFANSLLFDREDNFLASALRMSVPKLSPFSCAEKAFFGAVS
jgi:hypothetical protein